MNINIAKRAAHRRTVQAALQDIFNDPAVMPNADCPDLLVSINRIEFGKTVADIYIDVHAHWKQPSSPGSESPHERYMREARQRGEETYTDLNDVLFFPELMDIVSRELQRRIQLLYTPAIRRLADLGPATSWSP